MRSTVQSTSDPRAPFTKDMVRQIAAHEINDMTDQSDISRHVIALCDDSVNGYIGRTMPLTALPCHFYARKSAPAILFMEEINQELTRDACMAPSCAMRQGEYIAFKGALAFSGKLTLCSDHACARAEFSLQPSAFKYFAAIRTTDDAERNDPIVAIFGEARRCSGTITGAEALPAKITGGVSKQEASAGFAPAIHQSSHDKCDSCDVCCLL